MDKFNRLKRAWLYLCVAAVVLIIVTSWQIGSIDHVMIQVFRRSDHAPYNLNLTPVSGPDRPGSSGTNLASSLTKRQESGESIGTNRCTFNSRRQHLREMCETDPSPRTGRGRVSAVMFDHNRKTLGCLISKVASTSWITYIVEESRHEKVNKTISKYKSLKVPVSDINGKYANYTKYIIVKHPLQRLVTGYFEAIVQRKLHGRISFEMLMTNFANGQMVDIDYHWMRYVPFCKICEVQYDYILKMETLDVDLPIFNKAVGIKESATLPKLNPNKVFLKAHSNQTNERKQTIHKYDDILVKLHKEHPVVFEKVAKLYGHDMDMFGYNWSPTQNSTCAYSTGLCC